MNEGITYRYHDHHWYRSDHETPGDPASMAAVEILTLELRRVVDNAVLYKILVGPEQGHFFNPWPGEVPHGPLQWWIADSKLGPSFDFYDEDAPVHLTRVGDAITTRRRKDMHWSEGNP